MMHEGFRNHAAVKELQRAAVPVPFLGGCNAFLRNLYTKAFIVFPDSVMGLVVVVVFHPDIPITVQLFQRLEQGSRPSLCRQGDGHLDFGIVGLIAHPAA